MKLFLIIMLWVMVLATAVGITALFHGGYFWLRCIIVFPFVYAAVKISKNLNHSK